MSVWHVDIRDIFRNLCVVVLGSSFYSVNEENICYVLRVYYVTWRWCVLQVLDDHSHMVFLQNNIHEILELLIEHGMNNSPTSFFLCPPSAPPHFILVLYRNQWISQQVCRWGSWLTLACPKLENASATFIKHGWLSINE